MPKRKPNNAQISEKDERSQEELSSNESVDSEDSSEESLDTDDSEDETLNSSLVSYSLVQEKAVSLQKNYIFQMCGSHSLDQIAVASSDCSASLYDCNQFKKISTFLGHTDTITKIRFNPVDPYQITTSSMDGTICLWDSRKPKSSALMLKDNLSESGDLKPFLSFDISKSGHFICAGTELFEGDAYIEFWDTRTSKLLGAYWESHSSDITQVEFHPLLSDIVASGSTDGLINVYDLSQDNEDDALQNSLNTETPVDSIAWHLMDGIVKYISCVTDTMDFQIWDRDGCGPLKLFTRAHIAKAIRTPLSDTYLVNIHSTSQEDIHLLAGSKKKNNESLCFIQASTENLTPKGLLPECKQLVRCSWFNKERGYVVAAGEGGILLMWQLSENSAEDTSQLKIKSNLSQSRQKPY